MFVIRPFIPHYIRERGIHLLQNCKECYQRQNFDTGAGYKLRQVY